jgi:hypothetical protein
MPLTRLTDELRLQRLINVRPGVFARFFREFLLFRCLLLIVTVAKAR